VTVKGGDSFAHHRNHKLCLCSSPHLTVESSWAHHLNHVFYLICHQSPINSLFELLTFPGWTHWTHQCPHSLAMFRQASMQDLRTSQRDFASTPEAKFQSWSTRVARFFLWFITTVTLKKIDNLCIYIYRCICICIYVYVYMSMFMSMSMYMYMYIKCCDQGGWLFLCMTPYSLNMSELVLVKHHDVWIDF
jgi:hypothetical protein